MTARVNGAGFSGGKPLLYAHSSNVIDCIKIKEIFMKKGKLLAVALIGLMLAGGLVLASCRGGCVGAGTCEVKNGIGSGCTDRGCAVYKSNTGNLKCDC